jgi:periplasmic divalent cation tolerance protein
MLVEKINKQDSDLVYIYTTCADRAEARLIALQCIEERLAVSADFWPISSIYPWQTVIQDVDQYMLVMTTQKVLSDKLMKFIEGIHSYAVPVIAQCDVQFAAQGYRFWVEESLQNTQPFMTKEEYNKQLESDQEGVFHPDRLK